MCHPIAVHGVTVDLEVGADEVRVAAEVRTADRTGVEMEALTAVTVACLTIIDMTKALDPAAIIEGVQVVHKTGGASGDWHR
jgi:cyclic pyranopterin phosphate synthase